MQEEYRKNLSEWCHFSNPTKTYLLRSLPFRQVNRMKFSTFFLKNCEENKKVRIFAAPEPAKPLNDAQMCGSFFLCLCRIEHLFIKPTPTSTTSLLCLSHGGLTIDDPAKAESYLEYIGYYRLSAYMYPLLQIPKEQHRYKPGASFSQVMTLYRFDKKLRLFIFNEIEKIEVAVRSAIVNTGSELTGNPFWMTDGANFTDQTKFSHTMSLIDTEINRSREEFINHFKRTYSDPYPPAWILAEVLPFGVMTNIYSNIKVQRIKKRIAQKFGLQVAPFESWLTIVALTRNYCCHHARVWNKQNTIRPMMPNHMSGAWLTTLTDPLRVYFDLCIIKYFLDVISPQNDMRDKLLQLLADYPTIDKAAMGFPQDWLQEPL